MVLESTLGRSGMEKKKEKTKHFQLRGKIDSEREKKARAEKKSEGGSLKGKKKIDRSPWGARQIDFSKKT